MKAKLDKYSYNEDIKYKGFKYKIQMFKQFV